MKQFAILCFLLGSVAVAANSSTLYSTSSNQASYCELPSDSLSIQRGGQLFLTNCNSCHTTYISHAYDSTVWSGIISRMSVNAGLDSSQTIDVSSYIFDRLSNTDSSYTIRTIGGFRQW